MFPQKQQEQKTEVRRKEFLAIDQKVKWIWWQEETTYLFHPTSQVTEVKLIPATDGSFNVYARVDLKDRFEYKLVDNKKTLAAAKKLAEEFTQMLLGLKDKPETKDSKETSETKTEETDKLNGLEALLKLKADLEK